MKIKVRTRKVYICEDGAEFTEAQCARKHTIELGVKKLVNENFGGGEIWPDDIIKFILDNYHTLCSLSSGTMEKE